MLPATSSSSWHVGMQKTKVAIVGMGTVGTGVARLLLDHGDRTARHAGRTLVARGGRRARRAQAARRGSARRAFCRTTCRGSPNNREIKVVAQLIGGLEPARTIMLELLRSGKDVVTANKALLAEHGAELFDAARELGRSIAFEASVAGGIPIITNISQCSVGQSDPVAARDPQRDEQLHRDPDGGTGSTTQRPWRRPSGWAMPRRIRRWTSTAPTPPRSWRFWPTWPSARGCTGATSRGRASTRSTRPICATPGNWGYRIKLLAVAQLTDGVLELHVAPTLVRMGSPLAEVREAYNAISVVGDAVGPVFFHGLGAGQMPTASAVVADMIDTAVGRTAITFKTLELWSQRGGAGGHSRPRAPAGTVLPAVHGGRSPRRVMAQIAGVLGAHEVSIASIIQHEPDRDGDGSVVPLVIMTHMTTEGATRTAVRGDRPAAVRAARTASGCGCWISSAGRRRPGAGTQLSEWTYT